MEATTENDLITYKCPNCGNVVTVRINTKKFRQRMKNAKKNVTA